MIEEKRNLERVKEVKVKIPINYHIKLHSMKVLTGKAISDTVTEALDAYFLQMRAPSLSLPAHDLSEVEGLTEPGEL